MKRLFVDPFGGPSGLSIILIILSAVVFFTIAVGTLAISLERHYGRIHCQAFGRNTNRTTKFVIQSYVDSGVCLTPTQDGRWIPTDQLRDIR